MQKLKIERKGLTMSVQINTGKTTFTPEQQLELQKRLSQAKSRQEAKAIFEAYKKEVGIVDTTAPLNGSAPVQQVKNVDKPVTGTVVEKNYADNQQDKSKIVKQSSTEYIPVDNIITKMEEYGYKLDDSSKAELMTELSNAGIAIDKEGKISVSSKEDGQKLNKVLDKFAQSKQETQLLFDMSKTNPEFINNMIKEGSITKNNDGTFTVLNKEMAEKSLNKVEEGPVTEQGQPIEFSVDSKKTTNIVKNENPVEIPDNLKQNKDAKKQLTKDYEAYLTEWIKDPENEAIMNSSIALDKYDKKISKQMDKIYKECKNNEDVLDKYLNEYASPMEKTIMNKMLEDAKKDDKALLDAYNRSVPEKYRITSFDGGTADARKDIAAKLYLCEDKNFNPKVLVESMAVRDVMGARSEKQIEQDKKYFIEKEAERQVKADETIQNVANTKVYFSDEERETAEAKSGQDSYVEHNDIGKVGRKLVNECPDEFCDRVDNPEEATKGIEPMTVTDPKTGKTKTVYFKFNENKFKEFCKIACDSRHKDDKSQENFGIDGNLTLKEGRESVSAIVLIGRDGKRHSFEEIIGNDNDNVGNRELNKFRRLVMKSGQSVDKNPTWLKRLGHVALTAAGSVLGSMATAGLASPLVGAVVGTGIAKGQEWATADRYIDYHKTITTEGETILTPDQTVHVDGYYEYIDGKFVQSPDQTITTSDITTPDRIVNNKVTINGITKEIENIIPGEVIPGQEIIVPGTKVWVEGFDHWVEAKDIVVKGQEIFIEGKKIDINDKIFVQGESGKTDDQVVKTKTNNTWKQVKMQALVGAIVGLATGLATMSKKHAKGQSFDGIVNLDKAVNETNTEDSKFKLLIRQPKTVTVRSGEISTPAEEIGNKACKLRVSNKNKNTNIAEAKEDMVAVYYGIDRNSPDFAKVYKYVMEEINGLEKYGTYNYTKNTTYYLPDKIPASVIGHDIERKFNPEDPNERQKLGTVEIPLGGNAYAMASSNTQTIPGQIYHGKGKIIEPRV